MKYMGLYSRKWTPKPNLILGDPSDSGGSRWFSKEWMRKVVSKSTRMSKSLETLGCICVKSRSDVILLKGLNDANSSDYKAEEE